MSAGHGKGRKRGGAHEEEHENHERWAVSYADMMTVLMALFLVLFAMSSVEEDKYESLRASLAQGFGNEAFSRGQGAGILDGSTGQPIPVGLDVPQVVEESTTAVAGPAQGTGAGDELAARVEASRLAEVRDDIREALSGVGMAEAAQMRITERGLEVVVVSDEVFFANASADLQPGGEQVLGAIAPVIAGVPESIAIEGHTNDLPLRGGPFTSNWALSSMRATSVLLNLIDRHGIPADRLSAVGYADTKPLVPPSDVRALEVNRRVDIVLLSNASSSVRALLPTLAGSDSPAAPQAEQPAPAEGVGTAVGQAAPTPPDGITPPEPQIGAHS